MGRFLVLLPFAVLAWTAQAHEPDETPPAEPPAPSAPDRPPEKTPMGSLFLDVGALVFGGIEDPAPGSDEPGGSTLAFLQTSEVGLRFGWQASDNALLAIRGGVSIGIGPATTYDSSLFDFQLLWVGGVEGRAASPTNLLAGGLRYEIGVALTRRFGVTGPPAPSFVFGIGPTVWLAEMVRVSFLYRVDSPSSLEGARAGFGVRISISF